MLQPFQILQDLLLRRNLPLGIPGTEPGQGEWNRYVGLVLLNSVLDQLNLLSGKRHPTFLAKEQQQVHHGRRHRSDEFLSGLCSGDLKILGPCKCDRQRLVFAQRTIGKVGEVFPETLLPCPGRIVMAAKARFLPDPLLAWTLRANCNDGGLDQALGKARAELLFLLRVVDDEEAHIGVCHDGLDLGQNARVEGRDGESRRLSSKRIRVEVSEPLAQPAIGGEEITPLRGELVRPIQNHRAKVGP